MRNKNEIIGLVADGLLEQAVKSSLVYAEATADTESINGFNLLSHDLSQHKALWSSGQISFEEYSRSQSRISSALLGRIAELPDEPNPKATRKRIKEDNFKWFTFYLFIVAKISIFIWIVFIWRTMGFLNGEAFSLFNALMPGAILNISIMFGSLFKSGIEGNQPRRFVAVRFRNLIFISFTVYILIQFFLIINKANGNLPFELASSSFVAVETIMGVLMGEITIRIFRRGDGLLNRYVGI